MGPSGLPGASRPGFDIGLPVPRRMPPTAPPEPSPPPPPPLVDPCYHGEVHGVPLVFVIGSVECDHLIDYLCAEGYMIEVQTAGERALARLRNLPLLPDAMLVFSAVYVRPSGSLLRCICCAVRAAACVSRAVCAAAACMRCALCVLRREAVCACLPRRMAPCGAIRG